MGSMNGRVFFEQNTCCVWIKMVGNELRLSGQDLGGHPACDEYEYFITIGPDEFDKIRAALAAPTDADIFDVMCGHAESIYTTGETTWLNSIGVEYEFDSWMR